ncbi:MAG: rhombosortase [Gammaproteobacteria bacterium]|nr:rhombosortase [Gammaproteobacteria bacterium]MDH5729011.1 rhombosortase [Gammaproteobacteria bacterium]
MWIKNLFFAKTTISQVLFFLVLALICLTIKTISGLDELLLYDRYSIEHGEYWRLFSAHLVHLSWNHTLMNLAGLFFVFLFFSANLSALSWWTLLVCSCLGISAVMYFYYPQVNAYVGLSGVLHSLFISGALMHWARQRFESVAVLLFFTFKIIWEQIKGPMPGSESMAGGPVLTEAHMVGALIGLLFGTVLMLWIKRPT